MREGTPPVNLRTLPGGQLEVLLLPAVVLVSRVPSPVRDGLAQEVKNSERTVAPSRGGVLD